jgi:hypothetical protein
MGVIALICMTFYTVPASARHSQHATNASPLTHTITQLVAHVNGVLDQKCRSHFSPMVWSWKVWIRRHRIAHKMAKGTCLPAHNALWECIHGGEGSWGDTGDPYWGGLQMHPGWGGVHHASDLSPVQQKWLAEHELQKQKDPYYWVEGQWPRSHIGCMQFL